MTDLYDETDYFGTPGRNRPMTDMREELEPLPCPFCGGEAQLMCPEFEDSNCAAVMCMTCYATSPDKDDWRLAVIAWNTRADLVEAAREEGRQAWLREAVERLADNWTWDDADDLAEIIDDILAQPTFTPPDETGCQECGGENPVWFAPHDLWNRVMGGEDCKDDPGGILCPVCFIRKAEMAGIKEIWRVGPVEDNPPRSKGMTVQEVFMDAGAHPAPSQNIMGK